MRTADVMNKSLTKIAETRARVFVLDIAGVATVDTGVANQLIKITKATAPWWSWGSLSATSAPRRPCGMPSR
jgi:signal recognition particle GTPase